MTLVLPGVVRAIVDRLSMSPEVVAIALGGSIAAAASDVHSDFDIYVFTDGEVPVGLRENLARGYDPTPEIDNRYFGPTDEWGDTASGVAVDLTYWDRQWFESAVRRTLDGHQPALGYTTAFWHTLRHAISLSDRTGWLAIMQAWANVPYPDALRRATIAFNYPLLSAVRSSYRHQIELAIARDDPVSVNHRVAALLASLFDIVFAANDALHPGEKRLLARASALPSLPDDFVACVRRLLAGPDSDVLPAIDALMEALDAWLAARGLLPA